VVEIDVAVERQRAFHGIVWRAQDHENYESFFVRPHQVGNPDAVQYTPVFHGVSGWQLYHGGGYWAPVAFPVGPWFTIRVVFIGQRAEVFVGDLDHPALAISELKAPVAEGRIGVLVGGPGLHLSRFAHSTEPPRLRSRARRSIQVRGVIPAWEISDAFPESALPTGRLTKAGLAQHRWTRLVSEPTGLANLARIGGTDGPRNTVFARAVIRASRTQLRPMDLGFSDRAVVWLNGRPLFRGDDTYRSRDYRFLGSIGWYDTVHLPLERGDNELVIGVSETFGGWGVQARFADLAGIGFA
jgi:hypothetical protein